MPDLLSSDRLIVNQKAKLIEVTNQYLIRDAQGEELGYMQQEGQSTFRRSFASPPTSTSSSPTGCRSTTRVAASFCRSSGLPRSSSQSSASRMATGRS